jgi:hypothetical protein
LSFGFGGKFKMTRITRVEVIDENGRSYVNWEEDNDITVSYQDDGRTLKVFVNTMKPETGEERALEALDKFQNDWLLGKKCPETKLEIKNLNSVESIKAEIKVLQSKLEFYEELEKQPLTLFDVIRNLGYSYDCCYEIVDAVEEFEKSKEPEKWDVVRESVKWCEEHQNESVEDYLTPQTPKEQEPEMLLLRQGKVDIVDYNHRTHYRIEYTDSFSGVYKWFVRKLGEVAFLEEIRDVNNYAPLEELYQKEVMKQKEEYPYKKYTPEKTEKSLRTAFGKAQQTEKWKEIQKLIDEEDNDKNFKNSLDLIKEWGEKNKPPTLYEILMEWWINHLDMEQSDEEIVDGLVNIIGEKFIPPSSDRNGYEWEKCLKMMRGKLR